VYVTTWINGLLISFQELEKLTQKFSENVLDATKKFEKLITDKKEIEGLPATALGLAAQTAVSKVLAQLQNLSSCFFYYFYMLMTSNIVRAMKMLQLKMDLGLSRWMHQAIFLLCNMLETESSGKKFIVLI
jgi:hypothetical protein